MDQTFWTYAFVVATFGLYIGIAIWAKAGSTADFYVAGHDIHPTLNGMATAADWMSAASFLSMAGLIAFLGYGGSVYLMGWTGGYVLLALLLAPYLRGIRQVHRPGFRRRPLLQQGRADHRRRLRAIRQLHLYRRADERRRRGVFRLPRHSVQLGHRHRLGDRLRLCRAGRNEGHHLHSGRAICAC